MRFGGTIELGGKTATGIEVPAAVIQELDQGKRPAVTVTVNGYTYRTTVGVMSGRYLIPLSAEHRTAAGLAAGDPVEVDLEVDTSPREVSVPAELAEALSAEPAARASFDRLSYSRQRALVLAIEGAKTDETRQRRVVKTVSDLAAGDA